MQKAMTIMQCARIFSLPMTIFSWLIIFTYAYIDSGNITYGLIALIGLCFAHLGTNLADDYFDYKNLIKQVGFDKKEYLKHSQKTKCRYLINGTMKESQLIGLIFIHLSAAFACGLFLYFKCGIGILYYTLVGAFIVLLYPILSRFCLSEILVAIAYGPALFGGVYYAMCGTYSSEVFILAIPSMIITVVLLYIHTIMDYQFDLEEGKRTLSNLFNSQLESLVLLKIFLTLGYLSIFLLCIFDITDWQVFLAYLTIPLAVDLYNSMKEFSCNPESIPQLKWYHFPMENLKLFIKRNEASFMIRMFQSRNLMIYFSILLLIGILLSLCL